MKGKTIALAVLSGAVLIGGIWFTMFNQDSSKPNEPTSSVTSEREDDPDVSKEPTDTPSGEEDEPKNPEDIEIAPSDNPNQGIEVGQETDQPYVAKGELADVLTGYFDALPEYGGYATNEELWHITSHEEFADKNEKFKGLYSFMTYAYFTVEKSIPSVSDPSVTIDYEPWDEITISGFATVEDGTVTVHYINAANLELIDDGFIDDDVYMILHNIDWSELTEEGQ